MQKNLLFQLDSEIKIRPFKDMQSNEDCYVDKKPYAAFITQVPQFSISEKYKYYSGESCHSRNNLFPPNLT